MPFDNALTRLLNISSPIVLGPMANASGGELAAATSLGGGFGLLGAGYWDPRMLADHIQTARAMIDVERPPAATSGGSEKHDKRLPFGVGFLVWRLAKVHGAPLTSLATATDNGNGNGNGEPAAPEGIYSPAIEAIETTLRARPKSIWLSFGEPADLVALADFIRTRDAQLSAELGISASDARADPLVLMVGVGNEEQARHAVEQIGCDVLAVTGNEAGGHGLAASPSLFTLLPRVAHILPTLQPRAGVQTAVKDGRPLLLGAGGLSSGSSLAAVLAMGAQGAVFGTRYLLTPEAMYSPAQKELLQSLGTSSSPSSSSQAPPPPTGDTLTLRTMAFDDARGTLDWPAGVDGRGVRNQTVEEYERDSSEAARVERQKRYAQAAEEKDVNRVITWAGTGVGVMQDVLPAKELTLRLTREAEEALRQAHGQIA
ncbi:hypothetical protein OC844_007128 [Tilletia horrida]|nr:hypothetical protein OC844_007128 [Tilletia horrida]